MTTTLYGIRNCDTMKRARTWLDARQLPYAFHDYKIAGIERATLERWSHETGWEQLINRSGTTFRKLPEAQRADLDEHRALALMLEQPSMIRRPVLENCGTILVGFDPSAYATALQRTPSSRP